MIRQHRLSSKLSLTYRVMLMLTISKVFAFLCILCLCGNREYPGSLQNKLVSSLFKWVPKYFLFLAELKGEGRSFLSGQVLDLSVCSYHVTCAFQSESTLYSCLNIKELLARSRREIWSLSDCNWTRTHNHLDHKRTLNHLVECSFMN